MLERNEGKNLITILQSNLHFCEMVMSIQNGFTQIRTELRELEDALHFVVIVMNGMDSKDKKIMTEMN